ncbi:ABC transporter substrate-binding protein [Streptomyces aidingensis]|uniref:Peptide/nickel transport system substrate-binding protein n=1 Tax=Streptomyces aidingensis TaxID=910347 RepID=A0A1I1UYT1_9ACTN|nr:ABC transporter substrate-binding protein [Streptomyces aidingensis]SFD75967.1 peptide/nickel transport system substrate-binding protein [Streptomyces aidingensis]
MRTTGTSRRTVLAAGGGTAAALALAACGGSGSGGSASGGTGGSGEGGDATPRSGGKLRAAFAGGGAGETLDPHLTNLFADAARAKALFDKLAEFGSDMSAQPRLAERWEPNDALDRWTITLRDALWHDGKPVTAADVLYSYRRIADPGQAFRAKAALEPIDLQASEAPDDRTVVFQLKRPYADFPNVMAAFGAYIVQDSAADFTEPVGCGPFRFVSFTPGESLLVSRFDDYWEGAPHLDELEFVIADEESARINALLGGQVEYAHELNPATARAHETGGRIQIIRLANSAMQGFVLKTDRAPFDDKRVREAFFLIADRQELIDGALSGAGEIGNDLFGKGYQYYADAIPQREQDLDRARALLREAGHDPDNGTGLTVTLDTSPVATGFVEAAEIFKTQAAQAGVTVEVKVGNAETYWSDTLDGGMFSCTRSGTMPIESHISQRLLTDSPTNATQWRHADFDDLYQQAQATRDETERAALYERMQRRLHAEGGFLIWGFADWILGAANSVRGIAGDAPANTLDWARFDRVWLAEG